MERLDGQKIDFEKLGAIIRGTIKETDIVRMPIRSDVGTDDLKRILKRIGEAKCPGFVIDKDNKFVYENIFKWAIGDESFLAINPYTGQVERGSLTKGLYICGPTGTGKTMCLNIYRAFLDVIGAMVQIPNRGNYMLAWKTYFAEDLAQNCQDYGNIQWVQDYPVLCIQDIGTEAKEVVYMGNRADVIKRVLQTRGDMKLITVLSSNFKISDNPYGERVASRLCQMCNYYELRGRDRRRE